MPENLIACVPNFSEGRDQKIISAIADAIRTYTAVQLIHIDSNASANRTVYTVLGNAAQLIEAMLAACAVAHELIDMREQHGVHPRIGALDVCPFIPLDKTCMQDCVTAAREFAQRLSSQLAVPTYLYEEAATRTERKSLAFIRRGEYEGLAQKILQPEWQPDFGPQKFVARWGATAVGARKILIAYNVNLATSDTKLAQKIAQHIRESGDHVKPGLLKKVRAIAWYIEEFNCAQISCNLLDYEVTGLYEVYSVIEKTAAEFGICVSGSEAIGIWPCVTLVEAGKKFALQDCVSGEGDEFYIQYAIKSLGLSQLSPYNPSERILEYFLPEQAK